MYSWDRNPVYNQHHEFWNPHQPPQWFYTHPNFPIPHQTYPQNLSHFLSHPLYPTLAQDHPTLNFQTIGPLPLTIRHLSIPTSHQNQLQHPFTLRPHPRVQMDLKIFMVMTTTMILKIRTNKNIKLHSITLRKMMHMKIRISTLGKMISMKTTITAAMTMNRETVVKMTGITSEGRFEFFAHYSTLTNSEIPSPKNCLPLPPEPILHQNSISKSFFLPSPPAPILHHNPISKKKIYLRCQHLSFAEIPSAKNCLPSPPAPSLHRNSSKIFFPSPPAPFLCRNSFSKFFFPSPPAPILRRNPISKKLFTFAAPTPSLSTHPLPKFLLQKIFSFAASTHPSPEFHLQTFFYLRRNPISKESFTFATPMPSLSIHPSPEFPSPINCFSCLCHAEKSQHQSLNMKFCISHQVLNRSTSTFLHPPHVINRYKLHS